MHWHIVPAECEEETALADALS
jgi:hypothetical protein